MSKGPFTPEEDRIVGEMLREGHTYTVIGNRIDRAPNSVQSRVFRRPELKELVSGRSVSGRQIASIEVKAIRAKAIGLGLHPDNDEKPALVASDAELGDEAKKYDATSHKLMLDELCWQDCRWIVEGSGAKALFCGHVKAPGKTSYCEHHHLRAFPARRVAA